MIVFLLFVIFVLVSSAGGWWHDTSPPPWGKRIMPHDRPAPQGWEGGHVASHASRRAPRLLRRSAHNGDDLERDEARAPNFAKYPGTVRIALSTQAAICRTLMRAGADAENLAWPCPSTFYVGAQCRCGPPSGGPAVRETMVANAVSARNAAACKAAFPRATMAGLSHIGMVL